MNSRRRLRVTLTHHRLQTEIGALFGDHHRSSTWPPEKLSHYALLKKIARGSRGTVYLARDQVLQRCVVIKTPPQYTEPETRSRFRQEALCAALLNHPNIVAVYEFLDHDGVNALVMEYVPGRTLDRIIPRHGLPLTTCLNYVSQMAEALTAVHALQIVHRDLKPENFIVTANGTVKLLDFGLAKVVNGRRTRTIKRTKRRNPETPKGTILGTVGYMSPEQVRGKAASPRSDIFSFGAIVYEMLTGQPAFHERTPIDTMSAILHHQPQKLPARVPLWITEFVKRCLEKNPYRRYRTAKEMALDLERYQRSLGNSAHPSFRRCR